MAMHKREFEALVRGIKESPEPLEVKKEAARIVAEVARASNPRFDTARFFRACGLVEEA